MSKPDRLARALDYCEEQRKHYDEFDESFQFAGVVEEDDFGLRIEGYLFPTRAEAQIEISTYQPREGKKKAHMG